MIYVANLGDDTLSIINGTTNTKGTVNFKHLPPTQVTIPEAFLYGVVLGPTIGAVLGGFFAWWIPHLMERNGKQSPK